MSTATAKHKEVSNEPEQPRYYADPDHKPNGWMRPERGWKHFLSSHNTTVPGAPSTTRQAEVLNLAVMASPTTSEGILIGQDALTWSMVAHDPITAYRLGIVDSPNVAVLGSVGSGKSSLIKTVYLLRPFLLKDRRFVVIDKKPGPVAKDSTGKSVIFGEYYPVAQMAGVAPIRFALDGGGSRINLLDHSLLEAGNAGGTLAILSATCQLLDEKPLTALERKVLRQALIDVTRAERQGQVPILQDLVRALDTFIPAPELRPTLADMYVIAAANVAATLERLINEFPGLFDGETSDDVSLDEKLTVFDINAIPEDGPLISIIMNVINVWVLGTIRIGRTNDDVFITYLIVDEGWYLVDGPMGKVFRSNGKLARGLGMVIVVGFHHISDIRPDDPGIAFIKEAGTLHLYRQERRDDADAVEKIAGLQAGSATHLMTLPTGCHYLKRGQKAEIYVRHLRSELEDQITNSDGGLLGKTTRSNQQHK